MKKCPNCGATASDDLRYCNVCGAELTDASANGSSESWYYVDNGQSRGPYDVAAFTQLITAGTVTPDTYIWTQGMSEWTPMRNTSFYSNNSSNSGSSQIVLDTDKGSASTDASQVWFYAINGHSFGPYSESVMGDLIAKGELNADSLVWKEGFADWLRLADTQLAGYLPHSQAGAAMGNTASAISQNVAMNFSPLSQRSVALYVILSIVTCGIFSLFWYYQLTEDVNTLCRQKGLKEGPTPIVALLLLMFTCGIYSPLYFWTIGGRLYQASDRKQSDSSTVLAILGAFTSVAAMMIAQSQLNELIGDGRQNNTAFH